MPEDNTGSLHFFTPTPVLPSSTATASPTYTLDIDTQPSATACGEIVLDYSYDGPTPDSMTIGVYGARSDDPSNAVNETINTLSNNIVGDNSEFWTVNVPQGVYLAYAIIPSLNAIAYSGNILVFNGSDLSCLPAGPALPISFSPIPSSTSASPTSSTSNTSSSSNATNIPALGAVTGSNSMSGGGIAGAVVGALAGIAALIALVFFLRRCRKRTVGGGMGGAGLFEKRPRGAVAIGSRGGSFSSAHGRSGSGMADMGATHSCVNSTSVPAYPSENAITPAISNESVGPSVEELWTQHNINNGPFSSPYDTAAVVPAPLNTHIAATSRSKHDSSGSVFSGSTAINSPGGFSVGASAGVKPSRHSSLLYPVDPFSTQPNTPSPRPSGDYFDPYGVSVDQGTRQGQVPVQLFSPPLNMSDANSFGAQSHQGVPRDISTASSSIPDLTDEQPASATAVASRRAPPPPPLPRTSSNEGRTRGKTTRKPAPTYAPSVSGEALELVEPTTPRSTGTASDVTTPTTAVGPGPGAIFAHGRSHSQSQQSVQRGSLDQQSNASFVPSSSAGNDWSSAAAHSHSTPSPAHSDLHLPPAVLGKHWPELNHKSSFGDRPVHYLIPDPPSKAMK